MTSVKNEKRNTNLSAEDKELDAWARQLASRPPNQIGLPQQGGLGNFLTGGNTDAQVPANNGFDLDSAIGKFTWHTISDKYIPCLFRNGEKYCCVRMVEVSMIGEYLRNLPQELLDCVQLDSYSVTTVEARLLGHINNWHCDGLYGPEAFTTKDVVIKLSDLEKFYNYLSFAYSVLSTGGRNDEKDYSKCAFLRVNSDNLIPYTVISDVEKGVPLFYFEGHTDVLKQKAIPLKGWELAYLKICCKVQGVRKDLISGNSLMIVKVSELRAKFPKKTVFTEQCWPHPKPKSLLPKSLHNAGFGSTPSHTLWTKSVQFPHDPKVNPPPPIAPKCATINPSISKSIAPTNTAVVSSNSTARPNLSVPRAPPSLINVTYNDANQQSKNSSSNGVNRQVSVRVANGVSNIPSGMYANSESLSRIKVLSPPMPYDASRLLKIPELSHEHLRSDSYSIRIIKIEQKFLHCINMRANINDNYLIVLQQFMRIFFPSVTTIYPTTVNVLKNCGVTTYLPNRYQISTLNKFGFRIQEPWEIPLIPVVEITPTMQRLRNLFRGTTSISSAEAINQSRNNGYTVLSSSVNSSRPVR